MAAITTVVTQPESRRRFSCAFSLPTVLASASSGPDSFKVPRVSGRILQFEVAFAGSGVATISLFSKASQSTGSLYELLKVTSLSTSFHIDDLSIDFQNNDTTQSNDLYISVNETGGSAATGVITVILWVEA